MKPLSVGKGWEGEVKIIRKPDKLLNTEVLETTHYEWFVMDNKNRPLSEERVNNFVKEFKKGNFFLMDFPAVVDGKYVILDGQHRFEACRRLGLPFYFRIATQFTLDKVTVVQTNAGWKISDYIHAFIKQGNQNYVVLQRFMNRYKFTASVAAQMITGRQTSLANIGFFNGQFVVKNEPEAHRRASCAYEIQELCHNIGSDSRFFSGVCQLISHSEYDHKRMCDQLKKWPAMVLKQATAKGYVHNFEQVYNYRLYNKNKVRFL